VAGTPRAARDRRTGTAPGVSRYFGFSGLGSAGESGFDHRQDPCLDTVALQDRLADATLPVITPDSVAPQVGRLRQRALTDRPRESLLFIPLLLLAAFAFCVQALSQIDTTASQAPASTMTYAIALTLAPILAIVGFLNRITRQ
jgi:hypothetical protein